MRHLGLPVAIIVLSLLGSDALFGHGGPYHPEGLSEPEVAALKTKAEAGDANAAYQLHVNYAIYVHDEKLADEWQRIATRLKHPQAERMTAYAMKNKLSGYTDDSPETRAQVLALYTSAARTLGSACHDLADSYVEGYFGPPDPAKARQYYLQGAKLGYRSCWSDLARYYADGLGGPRDLPQAYYWIALETRCVHPESTPGTGAWTLRNRVASSLTPGQIEEQLKHVDAYITQVQAGKIIVDDAPFGGAFPSEYDTEGRRLSDAWETIHRKRWLK